ncbi:hypothetical protein [Virgibacillus sp. MG-45]|uniref:hypothetical protein n=1 Tax=Virgibacillus sp. MG-45 TaxID=3102791 RepID=UPI002ED96ADF
MKQKRPKVLAIYDLFLATGAIWFGIQMVQLSSGIFAEPYPKNWAEKLPFDSWVMPGILAIIIFGLGNIIAAVFSFTSRHNSVWYVSAIMGAIFFSSLIFQICILDEDYIVTYPFLGFSVIQLCLSGYVFWGYRKLKKNNAN